jgi:tetratricopeptide (TPR) repeat protein
VHEARHQCDVATRGFDSVWNAERRAKLERAFAATGVPYAGDTWRRVAASLDDYRERWRGMAQAACEASRVRHEQSAELFDLRMECLAERRSAANALTELFAHADRAAVEHAVAATTSLEPLDACQRAATLRAIEPLPREAPRRARIDDLARRLADAQALDRIGRYPDALRAARPLAQEASANGYAPLTAATLLLLGRLETADQHWPQSRHTLVDAAAAALTGRDDRALAEIFIALGRASANAWDKPALENGEHWITLAVAAIDRLGGDERLRAHLFDVEGALYITQQRLEDALSAYRRSLELQTKLGNESAQASTLNDLGVVLVKQNRRREARSALEQSAALFERTLGPAHPKTGVPFYVLAQLLKDSGPLDGAEADARRALAIFQGALAPNHPRIGGALDTLGEVLLIEGKTDEALATFRRALSLRRPNDLGQAEDRIGLALVLASQDKLDDAVAALEPAVAMALDPAHHGLVLIERGELRLRKKLFAPALTDFETALATFSKSDAWGDEPLVYALVGIGKTQLAMHQAQKALPPLERAVQLAKNVPPAAAAHAEFALARAIVDAKGDAARADTLAHDAAARWAALGAVGEREPGEIKSWLLARAAR